MPRVSKACGEGLGAWDTYLVKHGCCIFDNEDVELAKLRADIRAQGFEYMSAPDSRARSYAPAEDNASGTTPVAAKTQLAARQRLLDTLGAKNLALPDSVLKLMTPPAKGFDRDRKYFATRAKPLRSHQALPGGPGIGEIATDARGAAWRADLVGQAAKLHVSGRGHLSFFPEACPVRQLFLFQPPYAFLPPPGRAG